MSPQGTSATQALLVLEPGSIVFYNVHSGQTYSLNGEHKQAGCKTICHEFLRLGCTFFGIDNERFVCIEKQVLEQVKHYPLRFVAAKGFVSMFAQMKRDMQKLIEHFYPGTNANSLLMHWPYQSN
jgi:hypothetical protein